MNISAKDVNVLRQKTGAGIMDCKTALTQAEGVFDVAVDILRKRGQKISNKRADRETLEGSVFAKTNDLNTSGVILSLSCETDFVAKNDTFISLGNKILDIALQNGPSSIDDLLKLPMEGSSIQETITNEVGKIGEKINIKEYKKLEASLVISYIHAGNNLGVLAGFEGNGNIKNQDCVDACKGVAMHIAAMNPLALSKEDLSKDIVQKELEIAKEQAKQQGKPEAITEKIAQGKLNKFYKDNTLLNQIYIKDNTVSVQKFLDNVSKGFEIKKYFRISIK